MDKLTAPERLLAECYLYRVDRFLDLHRLDPAEWYDVVIFGYLGGVQYAWRHRKPDTSIEDLHMLPLLDVTMDRAVKVELRRKNRIKNGRGYTTVSLDAAPAEDETEDSIYNCIPAHCDTEETVLQRDLISRILSASDPDQLKAMRYVLYGYTPAEADRLIGDPNCSSYTLIYNFRQKARAVRDDRPTAKQRSKSPLDYYIANREKILARKRANNKAYGKAHRDANIVATRKYYAAHRDEILARKKARRQAKKNAAAGAANTNDGKN